MQGTMIVIPANPESPSQIVNLDQPPSLETLQLQVGGPIEVVPTFDTVAHGNQVHLCYAFCDEEARNRSRPLNRLATLLWSHALIRTHGCAKAELPEVLLGQVVLLTGDTEFMESL